MPILGVCLGHQAIGQAFGGEVIRAKTLMHGKTSPIEHDGHAASSTACRRPSPPPATTAWRCDRETLPDVLEVTAWTDDGEIMGLQHKTRPIHGVQFHPESIATEHGHDLLANFLDLAGVKRLRDASDAMSDAFKPLLGKLADGRVPVARTTPTPSSPPACAASRPRRRSPPPSPPCACAARRWARSPPAPRAMRDAAADRWIIRSRGDRRLRHRRRRPAHL